MRQIAFTFRSPYLPYDEFGPRSVSGPRFGNIEPCSGDRVGFFVSDVGAIVAFSRATALDNGSGNHPIGAACGCNSDNAERTTLTELLVAEHGALDSLRPAPQR